MSQPSQPQYGRQSQPQYGYDGGYPQQGPPPQQGPGRYYTPGPNDAPPGNMHSLRYSMSYLQRQTLALQSHNIHLKMGRSPSHMPVRHHHLSSSNHNIHFRTLVIGYRQAPSVRPHPIPILTDRNRLTTIHKNYPHPRTQAPQIPGRRHTHLMSNNRSPRASIHLLSTPLQMGRRTGKGSKLKHRTPANKLPTPILL